MAAAQPDAIKPTSRHSSGKNDWFITPAVHILFEKLADERNASPARNSFHFKVNYYEAKCPQPGLEF
jgi:hypothetical protein